MLTLAVTAVVTGAMSELLVSAIEPTIEEIGIGTVFIGMVVVPLVGNVPGALGRGAHRARRATSTSR